VYDGKVTSIKDFGAFIEILPGRDGLCHISELDDKFVGKVEDVCKVGDRLQVKVIAIDEHDRIKLSRKVLLREQNKDAPAAPAAPRPAGEPRGPERPGPARPRAEPPRGRSEERGGDASPPRRPAPERGEERE
jgi:polyribonucleotide nucleotidyltransferase